jgi:hypothetical protein
MSRILTFLKSYQLKPDTTDDVSIIEGNLLFQATRFSVLYYRLCELTGKWSDAGEDQVRLSFVRILLDFNTKDTVTYSDINSFYEVIQEVYDVLDVTSLSKEVIEKEIKSFCFSLLGKNYNLHECDHLNKVLRSIGSDAILQGGFYGHDVEVIYGCGVYKKMGDYDVFFLREEWIRTPNAIIAMAAMIGKNEIFLRHESIATIFTQKWESVLHSSLQYEENDYSKCSTYFKEMALQKFNIKDSETLAGSEVEFINAIEDNVLFHEIGHGIIQYHTLPQTLGTLAESSKVYEENVLTALLEILADLAPQFNDVQGPVVNMCNIAKTNSSLASGMYYIYLSDTWFYDTGDNYMLHYSDFISFIMINYIQSDSSIDFSRLALDLEPNKPNLLATIIDCVNSISSNLLALLETSLYEIDGKTLKYKEVVPIIKSLIKAPEEESYNFETAFWTDFLTMALEHSLKRDDIVTHINNSKLMAINKLYKYFERPEVKSINDHRSQIVNLIKKII